MAIGKYCTMHCRHSDLFRVHVTTGARRTMLSASLSLSAPSCKRPWMQHQCMRAGCQASPLALQVVALWAARVHEWQVERRMLAKCVARFRSRCLSNAWQAWRSCVQEQRTTQQLIATSVARIAHHQLFSAFSAWHRWAAQRHILKVLCAPAGLPSSSLADMMLAVCAQHAVCWLLPKDAGMNTNPSAMTALLLQLTLCSARRHAWNTGTAFSCRAPSTDGGSSGSGPRQPS